jgi:hypothetical protein
MIPDPDTIKVRVVWMENEEAEPIRLHIRNTRTPPVVRLSVHEALGLAQHLTWAARRVIEQQKKDNGGRS